MDSFLRHHFFMLPSARPLHCQTRDRDDRTPFGAALFVKDQNVAAAVLRREPKAIEETDRCATGGNAAAARSLRCAPGLCRGDARACAPLAHRRRVVPCSASRNGMTYLHQAVSESDTENVRFLLKLGVDVNAKVKVRDLVFIKGPPQADTSSDGEEPGSDAVTRWVHN